MSVLPPLVHLGSKSGRDNGLFMKTSIAGILEMSLVFGALLVFLIWELWSVRRSQRRDKEREQKK